MQVIRSIDRAAAEPFRVFFPLGVLASSIGVLLWPAYFAGWFTTYPIEVHARWMLVGFGGCFITGFLGTAGPRLLGSDPWCRFEIVLHTAMALTVMACLFANRVAAADLMTGFWLLGVLVSLLFRVFVGRKDIPPPGLPLAVLGLAGASIAGFALSMEAYLSYSMPLRSFWRLLYFQGFLWLPILGVAPYLLPRFFGRQSLHAFDDGLRLPDGWMRPFVESAIAGALLLASFVLEAWVDGRSGMLLRAAVVSIHLTRSVPGLVSWSKVNGLGLALRWVLPSALAGWLLAALLPPIRIGSLHMMFIGSVGLLMLAVAARVTLGHHNRHDRLASPMKWFHGIWALVLLTAATRLTPEFVPRVRVSHYMYAAFLWVFILAFWGWKLRRERLRPVFEEGVIRTKCPRRRRREAIDQAGPTSSLPRP
jgi:uncharacterized protein involved in response to NO